MPLKLKRTISPTFTIWFFGPLFKNSPEISSAEVIDGGVYEDPLLFITNDLLNKGFKISSEVVVVVEDEPLDLHEKVVIFLVNICQNYNQKD